jgi:hypothetical protein
MKKEKGKVRRQRPDVVLLQDLVPREEVRGGTAKRLFGERADGGKKADSASSGAGARTRRGHRK